MVTMTKERVELSAELTSAAVGVLRANHAYRQAWFGFWATVEPVKKTRFWELLKLFRAEIEQYYFGYKRTDGVEDAANEIFRKALVGDASYSMQEAYGFVKAYSKARSILDKRHAKLFDYCGDGFGDLMDSLPLAGEEFFGRKFSTEDELHNAVNELGAKWAGFINGENYIASRLEDAAKRYTLSVVCCGVDDPNEPPMSVEY